MVSEHPEQRRADPAEAEHQAEEYPGDHAHIARHQFLGKHHDGRECRGDDKADDHAEYGGPEQVDVGQGQGERCGAEDREPDDFLAADLVADRATGKGAHGHRAEEQEQVHLRAGHRQLEFLDQVEREVTGEAGHVPVFGEHQHSQYHQGECHAAFGQTVCRLAALLELEQVEVVAVPAAQTVQHQDGEHRKQAEPGNVALAVGNDDRRRQQRAESATGVAADLEGRLRQAVAPTGSQACDAGGFRVEGR